VRVLIARVRRVIGQAAEGWRWCHRGTLCVTMVKAEFAGRSLQNVSRCVWLLASPSRSQRSIVTRLLGALWLLIDCDQCRPDGAVLLALTDDPRQAVKWPLAFGSRSLAGCGYH
jgi:hypothetical protein